MSVYARLVQLGYQGVDAGIYPDRQIYKKIRDAADRLVIAMLAEVERQTRRRPELTQGRPDTRNWKLGDPELMHELRRAALHLEDSGRLPVPPPGVIDPTGDPLLRDAFREAGPGKLSHLIRHAESSGIYIPLMFPRAFWMEEPGLSVGSAPGLLLETEKLAGILANEEPSSPWLEAADFLSGIREACKASVETGLTVELYYEKGISSAGEV